MSVICRLFVLGALFCFFIVLALDVSSAEFRRLGLPDNAFRTTATDVSGDGKIVVGTIEFSNSETGVRGLEAFRWTEETGMVGLGDFPGGMFDSRAHGISLDGSTIVGFGTTENGREAFRWTAEEGMVSLFDPDGLTFQFSEANAASDDGSIIVGKSRSQGAVRWSTETGATLLPSFFETYRNVVANDISGDGSIIVGDTIPGPGVMATVWRDNGPPEKLFTSEQDLGELTYANGISQDGSVIVGEFEFFASGEGPAYRWTADNGPVFIGGRLVPDDGKAAVALGVSANGRVVVGYESFFDGETGPTATYWTKETGWRGLTKGRAYSASADGSTIVGRSGNEAFRAIIDLPEPEVIPEPSAISMMLLGLVCCVMRRRRLA